MRLYLLRHCDAVHPIESPARPLSERGREQARRLAAWAPRAVGDVDEIRHSGVLRAFETAEILATTLRPARGLVHTPGLTPGDSAANAADLLRHESGALLVVSHLPIIAHIGALLLGGRPRDEPLAFRTGTLAALQGEGTFWQLDWLVHPELLPAPPRGAE